MTAQGPHTGHTKSTQGLHKDLELDLDPNLDLDVNLDLQRETSQRQEQKRAHSCLFDRRGDAGPGGPNLCGERFSGFPDGTPRSSQQKIFAGKYLQVKTHSKVFEIYRYL